MAENKPEIIEIIEIIENKPEDKPVEKIDRRKIKKIKDVVKEVEDVEKIDKRKILRAPWRTTILEDGTKNITKDQQTRFIIKNIMIRYAKIKNL